MTHVAALHNVNEKIRTCIRDFNYFRDLSHRIEHLSFSVRQQRENDCLSHFCKSVMIRHFHNHIIYNWITEEEKRTFRCQDKIREEYNKSNIAIWQLISLSENTILESHKITISNSPSTQVDSAAAW